MAPISLHIVVLDCDTPVPNVYAERGTYADIFEALLRDAAEKTPGVPEVDLEFSSYDCMRGYLPSIEDLDRVDGLIITGSAASAYDDAPWIKALLEFTQELYTSHPKIHLFGSCFGHQLIAHALFSTPSRLAVVRDPKGWELGVHPITLTPAILSHFGPVLSNASNPTQLRLQFVHADHVVLHPIPEGFHALGSSEHCALQGLWQRGRVLTYQGHAEFDRFVNGETLRVFSKAVGWEEGYLEEQLVGVEKDDDAVWAAGIMLRFFLESEVQGEEEVRWEKVGEVEEENVMAML
ncbi:class I glutamine amidotransferase-like protein [Acephala macrosclerotiorum]|nr:class I glutamine amidotransferase-like protein [Acephala macrosclerotiorum]